MEDMMNAGKQILLFSSIRLLLNKQIRIVPYHSKILHQYCTSATFVAQNPIEVLIN